MVIFRSKVIVKDTIATQIKLGLFFSVLLSVVSFVICAWCGILLKRSDFMQNIWHIITFASLVILLSLFILLTVLNVDMLVWIRNGVEVVDLTDGFYA